MVVIASSSTSIFNLVVLALLGAIIGYLAVEVSSRRAARQPVEQDRNAEALALAALLASPAEVFRVVPALVPEDFTNQELAKHYRDFTTRALAALAAHEPTSDPQDRTKKEVDVAVAAAKDDPALVALLDEFAQLAGELPSLDPTIKDPVIHYGEMVMSAGASRSQNTSRSPLVDVNGLLTRQYVDPSSRRRVLTPHSSWQTWRCCSSSSCQ